MDDKITTSYDCWLLEDKYMCIAYDDKCYVIPVDENHNPKEVMMLIFGGEESIVNYYNTNQLFNWGSFAITPLPLSEIGGDFDNFEKNYTELLKRLKDSGEFAFIDAIQTIMAEPKAEIGRIFMAAITEVKRKRAQNIEVV